MVIQTEGHVMNCKIYSLTFWNYKCSVAVVKGNWNKDIQRQSSYAAG